MIKFGISVKLEHIKSSGKSPRIRTQQNRIVHKDSLQKDLPLDSEIKVKRVTFLVRRREMDPVGRGKTCLRNAWHFGKRPQGYCYLKD
jgi:hypothetical protein